MKIIIALFASVALAGAVLYYIGVDLLGSAGGPTVVKATSTPHLVAQATSTKVETTQKFTGSIPGLLAQKGSWQCDIAAVAGGTLTSGSAFVANGKMRGDVTAVVPQVGNVQTHLLVLGNTVYAWASLLNRGMQLQIFDEKVQGAPDQQTDAVLNHDYDFTCTAWKASEARFVLPEGIVFY